MRRVVAGRAIAVIALVCALAALSAAPSATAEPARPDRDAFGIQIGAIPASDQVLDLTKGTGAGPVRYGSIDWTKAEPTQGHLDEAYLAKFQAPLAGMAARGLRAEVVLFGAPAWAQAVPGSTCGPLKPEAYDEFAAFAAKMVQRFKAAPYNVSRWEIWNEPDAPVVLTNSQPYGCWGRPDDPYYGGRAFGDMLKVVYPAIKAADPKATVIFGGLLIGCGVDGQPCDGPVQPANKFLSGALAAGAGAAFDELAFHEYPTWSRLPADQQFDWEVLAHRWAESGGLMLGKLHGLRQILGDLDKPIIMNEGGLLWCPPANEDPDSWCAKEGITEPGDDYFQAQANYVVRLYTRAWANGIEHATWYHIDAGGWRGSGLLSKDNSTKRLGYQALAALTAKLGNATYVGGTVADGRALTEPFEDYRFCAGNTEHRIMWTNRASSPPVQLQTPTGVVAATDKLGRPVAVGDTLSVGFEPILLQRDLGRPCTAGRPAASAPAVADLTVHRVGDHWRQVAVVADTLVTRDSTDAAGHQWPATWARTSMAQAFAGPAAGQAPPTDTIDALTQWQPPGQNGPRQEVFAGGGVWRRDAADPGATTWGSWSNSSLAAEWGDDAGGPPTDRVDAVAIRPGPAAGQWRQAVVAGDRLHIRDSADGLSWPRTWESKTLAETWGADGNHPPTDRVDALAVQSTTDGQGQARWRQTVVAGEAIWTRLSTDERGTQWPGRWDSSTLAASWGASTAAANRPPVWAAAGPWTEPEPRPAPTTPTTSTVATATTRGPSPTTTAPRPAELPGEDDASPLGGLPFTGAQIVGGLVIGLVLMAAGSAFLLAGRRGHH